MRSFMVLILSCLVAGFACEKQELRTPLESTGFSKLTSYGEIMDFCRTAAEISEKTEMKIIGKSAEGREIPAVFVSSSKFGEDTAKIRAMVFAQQHGNEASGKEGVLLLLKEIVNSDDPLFLNNLDLILVPQVNPDGGEKHQRRNSQELDLNRNHLILTSSEVRAVHDLFWKYLPEATLDVHEYTPYSRSWTEKGIRKNFDEQFGTVTNPNIHPEIREHTSEKFLPFIKTRLEQRGYSFHEYIIGTPDSRIRYSTVDISDGRQSLGIMNTFSLILEGINAREPEENLERRSLAQYESIRGFLEFISSGKDEIKRIVGEGRKRLLNAVPGEKIAVRMDHFPGDKPLELPLKTYPGDRDTVITVENYHPLIRTNLEIEKPVGYLVPKDDTLLTEFIKNHHIIESNQIPEENVQIEQYQIVKIDSTTEEGLKTVNPVIQTVIPEDVSLDNYTFLPVNQMASNLLVLALEPQSMLGLVTYEKFAYLLRDNTPYPVLRVTRPVEK